jgi:hypothetical protein
MGTQCVAEVSDHCPRQPDGVDKNSKYRLPELPSLNNVRVLRRLECSGHLVGSFSCGLVSIQDGVWDAGPLHHMSDQRGKVHS